MTTRELGALPSARLYLAAGRPVGRRDAFELLHGQDVRRVARTETAERRSGRSGMAGRQNDRTGGNFKLLILIVKFDGAKGARLNAGVARPSGEPQAVLRIDCSRRGNRSRKRGIDCLTVPHPEVESTFRRHRAGLETGFAADACLGYIAGAPFALDGKIAEKPEDIGYFGIGYHRDIFVFPHQAQPGREDARELTPCSARVLRS